jgi:hypothetical protein
MKKAQLRRMIYDSLKPEMPELVVCHEMICVTPVNSVLRGVMLSPRVRSPRLLRVCTFARPLFCPDAGLMGATSFFAWGLLRFDVWDFDKLEDPRIFRRLLQITRRKLRRLSLVDTPERFAKNYLWAFGRPITGWAWMRIGFSYAHAGHYKKASKILRRKVLTWKPDHEVHTMLANYSNPVIEAIEAGDHRRVREQLAQWEEFAIGGFQAVGANLNILY